MSHFDEVAAGLAILSGWAQEQGCTLSHRSLGNRSIYLLNLKKESTDVEFTLSEEYLADLPGTKEYQRDSRTSFIQFAHRLRNPFPNDFYSRTGTPFSVEFRWPFNSHPSRDVLWLPVTVSDLRFPDLIAKTAITITGPFQEFELRSKPFKRFEVMVNSIRVALDNSEIEFYKTSEHPSLLQEIMISDLPSASRSAESAVEQFLVAKVYWLAFRRARKAASVWIADPWDAAYLGVSTTELIRAAEVAQARRLIHLSTEGDFASAEDALIAGVQSREQAPPRRPIGFTK